MVSRFLIIVVAALIALPLMASVNQKYSADCKTWKALDATSLPVAGFMKGQNENLYVDLSKKIWMSLSPTPMIFVLKESEVHVLTPKSIDVIPFTSKHPDKMIELMSVLVEIGHKTIEESRWVVRTTAGRTMLAGLVGRGKSCSVAPKAKAFMCRTGRPCSIVPRSGQAGENVSACANEVGMLEPSVIERLDRSCAVLSDGKTYSSLVQTYSRAKLVCGVAIPDFPSVAEMKRACEEGRAILRALK